MESVKTFLILTFLGANLLMGLSCSTRPAIQVPVEIKQDGEYDFAFPTGNSSATLTEILGSVKRV